MATDPNTSSERTQGPNATRRVTPRGPADRRGRMRGPAAALAVLLMATLLSGGPASAQEIEADVYVAQAVVAYEEKRYDDALQSLRRALELNPGARTHSTTRAWCTSPRGTRPRPWIRWREPARSSRGTWRWPTSSG